MVSVPRRRWQVIYPFTVLTSASFGHSMTCLLLGCRLHIGGYAGYLECPDPALFCARETLSGMAFAESSSYVGSWYSRWGNSLTLFADNICRLGVWLGIAGILLFPLSGFVCCVCPFARRRCRRLKRCCFLPMYSKRVPPSVPTANSTNPFLRFMRTE